MSAPVPLRPQLVALGAYHSLQAEAEVRLNTNESPYAPPVAWQRALAEAVGEADFHRYPDRDATELRGAIAATHGVSPAEVFCANGSNEVLQCLLVAFGGPGRRALVFEPTYALHAHIAGLTGMDLVTEPRGGDLRVDPARWRAALERVGPDVVFVCSPNNPTGRLEDPALVAAMVDAAPGLVVVDEAYGQFSSWSALALRGASPPGATTPSSGASASGDAATPRHDSTPGASSSAGLVVVRTFSKTWAMAGARLGYLVADPEVVDGCRSAALPYHLSVQTQLAGLLALRYADDMDERVAMVTGARGQLTRGLAALDVDTWPSDANFVLFRPRRRDARDVWAALLADGVLVRDFSSRAGLEGCLRVTVGTPKENERFLEALAGALG
ncbi:MAG TPA: histidinol-phosphate transaminase [Acidimicrobiales bacterium]|nr:histidinol-phosphate transaminase [Acidimicrobiales bacterium]